MKDIKIIEKRGRAALNLIRANALSNGKSFLIYDENLPIGQCYMEYPDGDIKIVKPSSKTFEFIVYQELDASTVLSLRQKFELTPVLFALM